MTTPATPVDVSPMILTEFVSEGRRYRTTKPLVFTVSFMADDELYLVEGEYHTILWGASREEAWDVLLDHFDWMWRHFAEGDPARLSGAAIDRGAELRHRFSLAVNAS